MSVPGTPPSGLPATYRLVEPPLRVLCVDTVAPELAREWMRCYESWFDGGSVDSDLEGIRGGRVALVRSAGEEYVAKRDDLSLLRRMRYALRCRPARSRAAFRLGLALSAAGIETSRPLALIERRPHGMGLRQDSCLVLERVRGRTLRQLLIEDVPGMTSETKTSLLEGVARAVARFHAAGFRQRDLKATNIIVGEPGPEAGAEPTVSLIDFDGMGSFRAPPLRRVRVRDLARLGVSLRAPDVVVSGGVVPGDWEHLVRVYLEAFGGADALRDLSVVLAETRRWGSRKMRRNHWHRRPVT